MTTQSTPEPALPLLEAVSAPVGRDDRTGRFLPGNRCGGNQAAGRIAALRAVVLQAVDADEIKRALGVLYQLGIEEQNISALVAWLGYVLGRPREGGLLAEAIQEEQVRPGQVGDLALMSDAELRRMIEEYRQ